MIIQTQNNLLHAGPCWPVQDPSWPAEVWLCWLMRLGWPPLGDRSHGCTWGWWFRLILSKLSPSARQAGVVDHQVAPHLRPPEDQITWIWGQNLTWRHSSTTCRPGLHDGAPDNVVDYFKSSRSDLCSFWFLPQLKGTWKSWWAGGQVKLPSLVGSGYFPSFFSCLSFFPSSSPLPQLLIHLEVWLTSRSGSPPLQGSLCSLRVHNCVPDKY